MRPRPTSTLRGVLIGTNKIATLAWLRFELDSLRSVMYAARAMALYVVPCAAYATGRYTGGTIGMKPSARGFVPAVDYLRSPGDHTTLRPRA